MAPIYFIADYHALTTVREPDKLNQSIEEAAATWLALGLNPEAAVLYRQSAVPEIFELMWVLACVSSKGLLNRGHAYKAAIEANLKAGRDADANITAGLFNYPLLMAADILSFQADLVPVGLDQRQHVEIARDVAAAFNHPFGPIFKLPQATTLGFSENVPGLDGRKMSKSYGNEIPLMTEPDTLRHRVMRIVTDSRMPEEPKDPEKCTLFAIYRLFAEDEAVELLRQRYLAGGVAYQTVKENLADLLIKKFASARERYRDLLNDRTELRSMLNQGAIKARDRARRTLADVRYAVGIDSMKK